MKSENGLRLLRTVNNPDLDCFECENKKVMKKNILVAVDFTSGSKSGVRFALQLASQVPMSLTFFHVIELLIPTRWNDVKAKIHMDEDIRRTQGDLLKFVRNVSSGSGIPLRNFECVVRYGSPVDLAIAGYAKESKADYICMGTRGAGKIRKIVGTYTSTVIRHSPIPVFAIPKNYKRQPIKHLLYASDLSNVAGELPKVSGFADGIKAKVSVLHYDYFSDLNGTSKRFEELARQFSSPRIQFYLQPLDWDQTLSENLKNAVKKYRPSLIALFTKQDKNWFERLFVPSNSRDLSFVTNNPIMVFPK